MPSKKPAKRVRRITAVVGLGLDGTDGHKRITRTEEMLLVGGSPETHERMQETAIRFAEELENRGQRLVDTPVRVALELLRKSLEKTGS